VLDGGVPVGVVSDRDLVVRVLAEGGDGATLVGEVMSRDVTTIGPDEDLSAAAGAMRAQEVRRSWWSRTARWWASSAMAPWCRPPAARAPAARPPSA
jgi:signal-transduction protein with cAMP-binding, CBS, and nucleotidyltransferase domain